MENNNNVSIGPTTIVGWLTALVALLPTIVKSVEEGQLAFNGPEKYLAIFGIAAGLITQIGRYLQAHKMINATKVISSKPLYSYPVFEEEKSIRPESSVKPDAPKEAISTPVGEQNQ